MKFVFFKVLRLYLRNELFDREVKHVFNVLNDGIKDFTPNFGENNNLKKGLQDSQQIEGVWSDHVYCEVTDALVLAIVLAALSFFFFEASQLPLVNDDVVILEIWQQLDGLEVLGLPEVKEGHQRIFDVDDHGFLASLHVVLAELLQGFIETFNGEHQGLELYHVFKELDVHHLAPDHEDQVVHLEVVRVVQREQLHFVLAAHRNFGLP
jgi:hypothetical protein